MPQLGTLWLFFISSFCLFNLGWSLSCYECQSKDDTVCLDPFTDARKDTVGTADCDPKATHCVKYKTVSFLQDSGFITGKAREIVVVSRFCIIQRDKSDGCVAYEGDSGFYIRCLCSSDNCNSVGTVLPNFMYILAASLLSLFFIRR